MLFAKDRVAFIKMLVGGVVLAIVVMAAIGLYILPGLTSQVGSQRVGPASTSFPAASSSTSGTKTSSESLTATKTSIASPTNTISTTITQSGASTSQPFKFIFSTSPDLVLLAPGVTQGYVTLNLVPVPSSLSSASEVVRLNYSAPSGISIKFADNPVKIGSDSKVSVPLTLAVGQSTAPGNYTVAIQGNSGTLTEDYSLLVRVVQYLVYITSNSFTPNNMTVRPGGTVFWMNLDSTSGAYPLIHTVTFTTGTTAHSSDLLQYEWYSVTFTATGRFSYHCEFHPQVMNAVVNVSTG